MNPAIHCAHDATVPLAELKPHPQNPNTHPEPQIALLAKIISEQGWRNPIVVSERSGFITKGHARRLAALRIGLESVPVDYQDYTSENLELADMIADNRIAELAELDRGLLRNLAEQLDNGAFDMDLTGFDQEALEELMTAAPPASDIDAEPQIDKAEELRAKWGVERGQIWELGEHRIMCGDSTSAEDINRLMDSEIAQLLATDPPYLVNYDAGNHPQSWANKGSPKRNKQWDSYRDPSAIEGNFFSNFLRVCLPKCCERVPVYQWHATRRQVMVEEGWIANGLLCHQTLIWVKARPILTRSHFMWQHEPCFYGWPEGRMPEKRPPANSSTVWMLNQQGENDGVHPTQKPLPIFERPIIWHTSPGDVILEPFLGSGSQLIAAERHARKCRAMEIDPGYVAVSIQRWADATGKIPKKIFDP